MGHGTHPIVSPGLDRSVGLRGDFLGKVATPPGFEPGTLSLEG
jgi:hypothetical protein